MKMIVSLSLLLSFSAYAETVTNLHCKTFGRQGRFELFIHTMVINQKAYTVLITDEFAYPMRLDQGRIEFNAEGGMTKIEASAHTDLLTVYNVDDKWMGEYWNDNVNYQLLCNKI